MGNIHILEAAVIGRIAAGEVVERPASVVKELVENSMDAGATWVRINIEQGGHKLIQVLDDGCGMDRQDAMLCLETHATSKLSGDGDVGKIHTLGFRGEAMPSIASVSHFVLQTCAKGETVGTEIVVDYGQVRDMRDCGCAPGTNVRVSQLFANLPARKKFLKGPETEDGYIEEMVRLLALARPDVTLVLSLNGRETLRANATPDLGTRVSSVLGKEMFTAMLPLDYEERGVRIRGFVTKPGYTRSSRREQRVIVNGRAATADTVYFAIRDSFDSLIMKGRYPGAVIYIDLPAERVDVNVHPTKREVRFRDTREIGNVVSAAIRKALRGMPGGTEIDYGPMVPSPAPKEEADTQEPPLPEPVMPTGPQPITPPPRPAVQPAPFRPPLHEVGLPMDLPPKTPPMEINPPIPRYPSPMPNLETPGSSVRGNLKSMRLMGRLGTRYAVAECETGLVLVNLRAAHQRILFEKLLKTMDQADAPRQQLLLPATINLGPDDARFLRTELVYFQKLGFQVEQFGGNSFIISAVPAAFPDQDVARVFRDMLDDLRQSSVTNRQSSIHLAQTACRHAISAREALTDEEVIALMRGLASCDMPYACPNGHPTMVHITYAELDKRFNS